MLNLARKLKTASGFEITEIGLTYDPPHHFPLKARFKNSKGELETCTYTKHGKQLLGNDSDNDLIYADEMPEITQSKPQKPLIFKDKVDTFRSKLSFIDAITQESFVNALAENEELFESFRCHFIKVFSLALSELIKKD